MHGTIQAAALVGLMAVASVGGTSAPSSPSPEQNPGQTIFHGKGACFACHGKDGVGTPVGPALNDGEWLNFEGRPTPEQLADLVKRGVPKPLKHPAPMPPMGGGSLDDEEVAAVTAYVLSLSAGG